MLAAVVAVPAAPSAPTRGGATALEELLPDLDIAAPYGFFARRGNVREVRKGATRRFRLSFASAADNVGVGPLIVVGHRSGGDVLEMTADQIVRLADGSTRVVGAVGSLEYVAERTHEHWHLLRFMVYELRRASDFELVRPDRKTGFCLGDRYETDVTTALPNEPGDPSYTTDCGGGEAGLLSVEEGISVGYGDDYKFWRDGQYIDVTGLPPGRYVLVHRVNPNRRLLESDYANNASSALLSITWPNGKTEKPFVLALAFCPDTARCRAS